MHVRFGPLTLLAAFAFTAVACGGGGGGYSTPTTPTGGAPPPAETGTNISIPAGDGYGNTSFSPSNFTVAPGGSVTWTNRDSVTHTSTSTTNAWNATLEPGASFSRTFPDRGSFSYRCTLHAGMTGTITVQ